MLCDVEAIKPAGQRGKLEAAQTTAEEAAQKVASDSGVLDRQLLVSAMFSSCVGRRYTELYSVELVQLLGLETTDYIT
jgi:hypothetical protein